MPQIVGHRGAAGYAPENTLLSFRKAIGLGCRAIELDVHLSKDGGAIVIHDAKVDRVTDGRGKVKRMTLAKLRSLRCSNGQHLPTLQEVIDIAKGKARMFIELKAKGTPEPVVKLIEANGIVAEVVVCSFKLGLLKKVKSLNPRIKVNYLFYRKPLRLWRYVRTLSLNYIGPRLKITTASLVHRAHKLQRKVYVYGVNDHKDGLRMKHLGVDAVCTDYPVLFLRDGSRR